MSVLSRDDSVPFSWSLWQILHVIYQSRSIHIIWGDYVRFLWNETYFQRTLVVFLIINRSYVYSSNKIIQLIFCVHTPCGIWLFIIQNKNILLTLQKKSCLNIDNTDYNINNKAVKIKVNCGQVVFSSNMYYVWFYSRN